MPKKKTEEVEETNWTKAAPECRGCGSCKKVELIAQEFGNGDLNTLRDKINEIINNL